MTIADDLLRVYEYGKEPYIEAIKQIPSYQAELQKTLTDYKGRSWIESPFKLPKFTDAEYEKRRIDYQAKYGTTVNIPGFNDIIHLKMPIKITAEEMAAHKFAQKRGLPSPLSTEQTQALQGRKFRFISMLAQPTPKWLRNWASIATFLDNTEDALITAVVMGRLILKASPFLSRLILPKLGWILLGSDIINATNLISMITFAANGKKRIVEGFAHDNPFHAKAAARRTLKLQRAWPTFGETLEILQTTDQLFGIGLCLGPIMGMAMDAASWSTEKLATMGLKMYGVVNRPDDRERFFAEVLRYGPIIGNSLAQLTPEDALNALTRLNSSMEGVWAWWTQNDPLSNIWGLNNMIIEPPSTISPLTLHVASDLNIKLEPFGLWPIINKTRATLADLVYSSSSTFVENFQTWAFLYANSIPAYAGGAQAVKFVKSMMAAVSDDFTANISTTAYASAAKDMARNVLQIPPDTPQALVDQLATWIGDYERKTGGSPSVKEIEYTGTVIGIKWDRTFHKIAFGKAAEEFPEWKSLQEEIKQLFVPD